MICVQYVKSTHGLHLVILHWTFSQIFWVLSVFEIRQKWSAKWTLEFGTLFFCATLSILAISVQKLDSFDLIMDLHSLRRRGHKFCGVHRNFIPTIVESGGGGVWLHDDRTMSKPLQRMAALTSRFALSSWLILWEFTKCIHVFISA